MIQFQVVTRMFKAGHKTLTLAKTWPIVPLTMFFYVTNIFCMTKAWHLMGPLNHFMKHMNPTVIVILRELLYCRGTHSPISIGKQLWSISTVEVRTPGVSGTPSVYFGHIELSLTFAPCIGFGGGRLEMGLLRNLDRNLKQLDNVQWGLIWMGGNQQSVTSRYVAQ